MRQPVANMFALATAALAEPGLSEPTCRRLEQILGQAGWLTDLIQHSMYTVALGPPDAGRTDLFLVISEAVAAEQVTWPGNVRILGEARPVFTTVHSVVLRRVLANLLGNATHAAGPSGTISVEIRCNPRTAMVAIEDTGPGFGKVEPGLGFGLVTVARCLAAYGGRLDCDCGASGGARVSVWLPRAVHG